MTHKYTQIFNGASLGSLTGIALFLVLSNVAVSALQKQPQKEAMHAAAPVVPLGSVADCGADCADTATGSSPLLLAARQLQTRLSASGGMVPGVSTLMHAMEQREILMKRSLKITVTDPAHATEHTTWTLKLADHPELVMLRTEWSSASYIINDTKLAEDIVLQKFDGERSLSSVSISSLTNDGKVTRAQSVPVAHDGFAYDSASVARDIAQAFENGHDTLSLSIPFQQATVTLSSNGITKNLDLLASGRSDFADSPQERVWNIYKAINERLNNVVVKPGETFSFVDTLGGPVTLDKGWKEGLGLFGGGAAFTPGAGICQAATTTFRAALLAGFPIVEKRNHSMWVPHYEPFGAGLDATIFPGFHDMRFKNDSTSTILIQAYIHDGTQVTVNIYGTSDHRSVVLDGPYFYNTPHRAPALPPLGKDEIGWMSHVSYADGKKIDTSLVATYYKGIPRSVMKKYAGLPGTAILHELLSATGAVVASAQ